MNSVVATLALQVQTAHSGSAGVDCTQWACRYGLHTVGLQIWTTHGTQWAYKYGLHTVGLQVQTTRGGPAGMDCAQWAAVLQVWTTHGSLQVQTAHSGPADTDYTQGACRYRLYTVGLHRGRLGVSEGRERIARLLHRPDLAPGDRSRIFTLVISFASSSKSVSPTPKAGGHRVSLELRCPLLASQREPSV